MHDKKHSIEKYEEFDRLFADKEGSRITYHSCFRGCDFVLGVMTEESINGGTMYTAHDANGAWLWQSDDRAYCEGMWKAMAIEAESLHLRSKNRASRKREPKDRIIDR